MHARSPSLFFPARRLARRAASCVIAAGWTLLGTSCAHLIPTPLPIRTVVYPADEHRRSDLLIVFLPGRGDDLKDFERHGFLTALRDSGVKADAIAVGAHLGYYYQRSIVTRLEHDVLRPARERGYRHIVIAGISLGGLGGVFCARDVPNLVDGLILLSPYLGKDKALLQQIERVGGPSVWAAGRPLRSGKIDEEIWTFLGQGTASLPPTLLCFGTSDYLREGQQAFAKLLPAAQVMTRPGAHDWKTWEALWKQVCATNAFWTTQRTARVEQRLA